MEIEFGIPKDESWSFSWQSRGVNLRLGPNYRNFLKPKAWFSLSFFLEVNRGHKDYTRRGGGVALFFESRSHVSVGPLIITPYIQKQVW